MGNQPTHSIRPRIRVVVLLFLLATLITPMAAPATAAPAPPTPPEAPLAGRFSGRTLIEPGGFLSDPAPGDPEQIARDFIAANRQRLGLTSDDLAEITLKDRYTTAHNGVTHLYFRQRLGGIELFNGDININITRDGRVLNLGNGFEPDLRAAANTTTPAIAPSDSIRQVAAALGVPVTSALLPLTQAQGVDQVQLFSTGGVSFDPIPLQLVYQRVAPGDVRLAWQMVLRLPNNIDWLNLRADALTGNILSQVNYASDAGRSSEEFVTDDFTPAAPQTPPVAQPMPLASAADGSSYRVYELPKVSPHDGERTLVAQPADAVASPFGWHDTNGVAGAEYSVTRGNNAFAYGDSDFNNLPDGDEPDGSSTLTFDFPIADLGDHPSTYRAAAIVNAFYVTNRVHDILFHVGFDEAAGNFQATNYSGQGQPNDAVNVEVQDGPATINANFFTPPDGANGRMQLYLGGSPSSLTVTAPPAVAGDYATGAASFGPQLFNIADELILAQDSGGVSSTDGCEPIVTNVTGLIALIDRGNCPFADKVANAQNGGAVGVIIVNDSAGAAPTMGGTGPTVTIPVLSVTNSDGAMLKAALLSEPVLLTMLRTAVRDVALDNGVIIHEYGHGLSTRLGGGPSNSTCIYPIESGSEGWSDFLALVLTAKPDATPEQPIEIGQWITGQPANGIGIRSQPYSTDMTVNTLTYDNIKTLTAVHAIGEIWATTLWDAHWALVDRYGFDPDLTNGDGGNRLALQLVIDGLKLQPCDPTFVEMRDAILTADVANNTGANQCLLWETFARRGLGYSAEAGSPYSVTDGTEAFDLPPLCTLEAAEDLLAVCIPSPASVDVNIGPSFAGPVVLSVTDLPANVSEAFSPNPVASAAQSTLTITTAGAAPSNSTFTITGAGPVDTYTYDVQLFLADRVPGVATATLPATNAANVSLYPNLEWAAAAQAVRYRLEVAREPTFADPFIDTTGFATSYQIFDALDNATTYFWRVTALNGCGNGSTSPTAQFTTRADVDLLLVDDSDQFTNELDRYTAALDALDVGYDIWQSTTNSQEPPLSILRSYRNVLWFSGYDFYGTPTDASEANLASWLPTGRCLMLSSQELFARNNEIITPFMSDYLGVASAEDDSQHTTLTGAAGTFLAGLGPFNLTYAVPANNYSDHIVPDAEATTVLTGNGIRGSGAAIAKATDRYRTLYMGFPAEALDPADLQSLLAAALAWCDELKVADLALSHTIAPPATTMLPGQPLTYTLTFRNLGDAPATGVQLNLTLPTQLTAVTFANNGPALTQAGDGSPSWQVADMAPGAEGTLTVEARVRSDLAVSGEARIEAAITTEVLDLNAANQSLAAALSFRVPTVAFAAAEASFAEDAGAVTLPVQLSEPNPYAATQVSYAVSGGTATSGADYMLAAAPLTIAPGASSAAIGLIIQQDWEEEPAETLLISLAAGGGVTLGAPAAMIVTLTDVPGEIVRSSTQTLSATEGGPATTYTIVLEQAPQAEVTVTVSSGDQLNLTPTSLTFTPANWNTPQTISVTAVDDNAVEGAHTATISHSVTSTDLRFNNAPVGDVIVSITDNDGGQPQASYQLFLPLISR